MTRFAASLLLLLASATVPSSAATIPGPRPPTSILGDAAEREFKFQLDLSLWVLASEEQQTGFYAAYQQRSLWGIDNESRPFRVENNFRPELGLAIGSKTWQRLLDSWPDWLALAVAYVHESNGLEGDASRGWNRTNGSIHLGSAGALVRASVTGWLVYRVEENNDDLRRYAGDGELRLVTDLSSWLEGSSLQLRSTFSTDAAHGTFFTNLEVGLHLWPRFLPSLLFPGADGPPVDFVIEWFVGTGEFLYDYSASRNQIRLGLSLRS